MGLMDVVKKQFIDIILWTEPDDEILAWRFPTADLEIQQGAQLIVRDTQMALFVDGGKTADLFGPGRHEIRTPNLPVLTDLRHWGKMFASSAPWTWRAARAFTTSGARASTGG